MTSETVGMTASRGRATAADLMAGFGLSYLLAGAILVSLVHAGGIWNLLANSRILSPLIEGGVIRYHDKQIGFIPGVPELKYYVMSQDPVGWLIAGVAVALMLGFWAVKSIQFRTISRNMGSTGAPAPEIRAYLFGQGLNRWLPFHQGDVGTALALEAEGHSDRERIVGSLYLTRFFTLFEIAFFGLIGLFFLGWGTWLAQLFWPLVILGIAYLFVRRSGSWETGMDHATGLRLAFDWLFSRPLLFLLLGTLSVLAFFLEHVAVYALSQAFTSTNVIINIEFPVFLMALVAGSVARLIPVTPGGIGQFEWGFAMAIYLAGTGMPEAVTIALLFAVLRYGVGIGISLGYRFFSDVPVTLRDVFSAARVGG